MKAKLPKIRELFIPDPGHVICDTDLDRADLQVVVWEANDDDLKDKLRSGADVHLENAKDIFGAGAGGRERALAKAGVHATNYGSSARTLARALGLSVHEAERFQRRWFEAHPGIRDWHNRVLEQLQRERIVRNRFGYVRYYLDRVEGLLPEALAWIPQSTVAIVTSRGWQNLYYNVPQVEVLLQVHDSLVWQISQAYFHLKLPEIKAALEIEIPYDDPLVIPVGLKASTKSWGHCRECSWNSTVREVSNG